MKEKEKEIVINFLFKCNHYSSKKIKKYQEAKVIEQETQKKIAQWQSYSDFNKYAIKELKETKLDSWFD